MPKKVFEIKPLSEMPVHTAQQLEEELGCFYSVTDITDKVETMEAVSRAETGGDYPSVHGDGTSKEQSNGD